MTWLKASALLIGLVIVAFIALLAFGQWRWNGLTRALLDRMAAAHPAPTPPRFDASFDAKELDGLPPVVQRYFRAVLPEGAPIVAAVVVQHAGSFNIGERMDQWKPFTSRQWVVTRPAGFVWDGRIGMFPGVAVHVHDAYIAGEGVLLPALLGLFSLGELRGTGEVARGELMRWFAEAAWYPTALLPRQGVRWNGIDERSARATVTDGTLELALTFGFDAQGLIESVRADARGRTVAGRIVMRPWEGRWSNYQRRDGMYVPLTGEAAWLLPEAEGGRKAYWRGTITSLSYTF